MSAGAAPLSGQAFAAYGSGDAIVTKALAVGSTQIANAEVAASGGAVNSGGLNTPLVNELGTNISGAVPDKNAVGRGTGAEVGLVTADPQTTTLNQLLLSGLAIATAPPNNPAPVTKDITLPVNPVLFASALRGQAQALYDPTFCPVGRPLTYGLGYAANAQLVNAGPGVNNQSGFDAPVVGTSISAFGTPRGVTQSRTVTYLQANGDGTFGVVSETRQTVAPISLLSNQLTNSAITLEIAGEFGLRVVATGKSTGSSVSYTGNPVITLTSTVAGIPANILGPITLQDLLGQNGLTVNTGGLLNVSAGAPPRGLNGALGSAAVVAPDGTAASGAVDAVLLQVLNVPGLTGVDLRVGHMEGAVTVPAGGLTCDIPVSKTASVDPVTVGQDFTYTIRIPSDPALFNTLFNCDLIGVSAIDTVTTKTGNPTIQLVSADHGGTISGNKVTWANLGDYKLGQDPITLTITARIPSSSPAGVLQDTVNVTAALGNCRGGATGEDIVQGGARLNGSAITGNVTLVAPTVSRGGLAATGGNSWPLVAGGGFLLAALGLVRLRRRATQTPVTPTS
jgi:hypothetical protein